MVSQLELEATRNVMLNVTLLLLYASTWITLIALTMICQANIIHMDMDEEETSKAVVCCVGKQWNPYHWAISYTRLIQNINRYVT